MNIDQISKKPIELTRQLAKLALATQFEDLPSSVQNESIRTFVNWMGCVLGGCNDPAVVAAEKTVLEAGAHPQASIVGRRHKTDVASAAFLNCLSSTVNSFDDTHLATVTHPTGPVAAALFAYAEQNQVSGKDFLAALSIGIEIECRLSNVLLTQPAKANLGLFITGITGPIGAAAALGRLMKLDETQMRWAIGLAAVQASGFRGTHGAMAAFFVPAHAARTGVWGAMLARNGLTCTDHVLESDKGFVEIFAPGANLELAVQDWGAHYEMLLNAYKPYPSGIVVQPIIDACLEIASQINDPSQIQSVTLQVNPLALNLTGRRHPKDSVEAQISLFHWAASCLLQGHAGLAQLAQSCVESQSIQSMRNLIIANPDDSLDRDAAKASVGLTNGQVISSHVVHARGSVDRPMTNEELDQKFMDQANVILPSEVSTKLLNACRNLANSHDVGKNISRILSCRYC